MIFLYIFLLLLLALSIKPLREGERWNSDYISKDTSNIVKGVCIWIVFICHISSYIEGMPGLNFLDLMCFEVNHALKQLLVVPFLFYSGYGVTLSILKKGADYANKIPRNRILTTLWNFDIAVVFFLLMNLCLGLELNYKQVLLSFTGWDSIRNSNWYIFCILICYLISWLAFKTSKSKRGMLFFLWGGILLYTAVIYFFKGHWWYDTIYAYGAGAVFAAYRDQIVSVIKNKYIVVLTMSFIGFIVFYNLPNYFSIAADIDAVFLCMLTVLFTLKVRLESGFLAWSGVLLFPIYIYQRLPMVTLSTIYGGEFLSQHRYLYIILCLIITLLIAVVYRYKSNLSLSKLVLCLKKA